MNELGKLVKSKVTDHVIIKGQTRDNGMPSKFGTNEDTFNIPFHSANPQPLNDPTTDSDDK